MIFPSLVYKEAAPPCEGCAGWVPVSWIGFHSDPRVAEAVQPSSEQCRKRPGTRRNELRRETCRGSWRPPCEPRAGWGSHLLRRGQRGRSSAHPGARIHAQLKILASLFACSASRSKARRTAANDSERGKISRVTNRSAPSAPTGCQYTPSAIMVTS